MSDQSPPPSKPKPGSLRDRIAAFEKPAATNAPPPPVRPKPGGISWKPKQPSPPASPDASASGEQPKRFGGGMSASDAKESIGRGGSLKERMAALQGKGAFGAPVPPPVAPKPAVEKPKWKPPPPVASPPAEDDEGKSTEQPGEIPIAEEASPAKLPPALAQSLGEDLSKQPGEENDQAERPEGQDGEIDPEEEERQRRAALAARMARLGGARVGMGPPVFGKPAYKKPEAPKQEAPKAAKEEEEDAAPKSVDPEAVEPATESRSLKSPPTEEPAAPGSVKGDEITKADYFTGERKSSDASLLSPESNTSTGPSPRTPSSMPIPAAPRRAGPPRRKAKSPAPPPVEERLAETPKESSEPPAELLPQQNVDAGDKEPEIGVVSTSADDAQLETDSEVPVRVLKNEPLVEESPSVTSPPTTEEPPVDDAHPEESSPTEEPRGMSIEETPISTSKADIGKPEVVEEPSEDLEPAPTGGVLGSASAPVEEEEEEEEARKRRVAERLAKMGGVNPFAPPPPPRKPSLPIESGDVPVTSPPASAKRTSTSSISGSFPPPPVRRSSQVSTTSVSSAARKASVGSTRMDESEEVLASKSSLDDRDIDVSASAHAGITEEPEEQDEIEHEDPAYNFGKLGSTSTSEMLEDDIDSEDHHGHEDLEEEPSVEVETPREAVPPPLPRIATRPAVAASDDVSDIDAGYIPPPPTALSADTDDEPVVSKHMRSIPSPPPQNYYEEADDEAPPAPPPRRSMPPPPRLIPQPAEDEYNAEAEEEEETEPAPTMRRESLPRTTAPDSESPQEPPRRLPPRPVLDDDGHESDAPLPHPNRRSVPPPPPSEENLIRDTTSEDGSPAQPIPSSRPIRFVPPPPPLAPPAAEENEEEDVYDKPVEEEILPTPPRGPLPTHQTPAEDEPLIIPPPPPRLNTNPTIAQRRTSVQPAQILPSIVPEQTPPIPTPTLSVSDHSTDHDQEILDEEEGDPIDPSFHSPPSRTASFANLRESADASPATSPTAEVPPAPPVLEPEPEPVEDEEQVRRRTIAERMAKLGGIKFGAAPIPMNRPPPPVPRHQEESETGNEEGNEDGAEEKPELTEEEEERARKERIAAKLASMGGMRIGMSPFGMVPGMVPPPSRAVPAASPPSSTTLASPPPPPAARHPPPPHRAAPPSVPQALSHSQEFDSEHESQASEDGVKVEAEESEMEEVNFEDAQDQEEAPPPPVPSREGRHISLRQSPEQSTQSPPARPPVPAGISGQRRTSVQAPRKSSDDFAPAQSPRQSPKSTRAPHSQSDYVMVEESDGVEAEITPPPPPRPAGRPPPRGLPPPPQSASDMPESISSQWELPSIPSVDFGATADLSLSWTDDIAAPSVPPPPEKPAPALSASQASPAARASVDQVLSPDDLMAIWGRVGVQICETANAQHEKSKRALIGDGTYHGFVDATLKEVPNAAPISPDSYGYLIYQQSGGSVQKRASDILGGDVIWIHDAKFKGHKGIQTYHQTAGSPEPLVGIVSDFEAKKFKVRVFQANQHVGQQTVESVSYRLEDLKSGTVKVFRVLEA